MRNLLFVLFFSLSLFGKSQNWLWAKLTSGNGNQYVTGNSCDRNGNVFVTGWYYGSTMSFGSTTITNNGGTNIFLAKYNINGNVLWAKSIGGSAYDYGWSVRADSAGNVILVGMFTSSVITLGTNTYTNAGDRDILIAKYDAAGNFLWSKAIGGNARDEAISVTTDISDNVFVTGRFSSPSINFGNGNLMNNGGNMFVVKYSAAGVLQWVKRSGGGHDNGGSSVACDPMGNVYVAGGYGGNIIYFGSNTITTPSSHGFLIKYDSNGNIIWVKQSGGPGSGSGNSISTDRFGNIYMVGSFMWGSVTFGAYTLNLSAGYSSNIDFFIAKYDPAGNVLWAQCAGDSMDDEGMSVNTDLNGNTFVTGRYFSRHITFGTFTLTTPNPGSDMSMFIVKYNPNGYVNCATTLSSGGYNNSVSVDLSGNASIVGDVFNAPLIIGSDTLNIYYHSVFISKYACRDIMTNINNQTESEHSQVYPNPSNGMFSVRLNDRNVETNLFLYDILGNCILKKEVKNEIDVSIEINHQPKGIYFLEIESNQNATRTKIIKD